MKKHHATRMRKTSILLADDHELVRQGLCSLLETRQRWRTMEAIDGQDVVFKARCFRPDVVIMDLNMPGLSGLEAIRQIQKALPTMPVIVLSGYSTPDLISDALEAGVRGYVLKTDAAKYLVAAVDTVRQGGTFFTGVVCRQLLETQYNLPLLGTN